LQEVDTRLGGAAGQLVVLVDSTDHFQGSSINAVQVESSVQALFTNHYDKLQLPVHAVYTVPPYLKTRAPNLQGLYGGGALTVIPIVRVRRRADGQPDRRGTDLLRRVVEKRGDWQRLLGGEPAPLERLILLSGGHFRELLRMLAELTRRARNRSLPLGDDVVEGVIQQARNEMLPIADNDARWLARVAETQFASLPDTSDVPDLARFLDHGLVFVYRNGEEWYDVHPLVKDYVIRQVAELVQLDPGLATDDGVALSTSRESAGEDVST
jgi:hypothetical protein